MLGVHCVLAYRLEGGLSVGKVQCSEKQPALGLFVAFGPAPGEQVPFWLEFPAQHASKAWLEGGKQNDDGIVPRSFCQLGVHGIIELERAGQRLGAELAEAVSGRLLGCKRDEGEQRGCEELEPPHCA